MLSRRGHAVCLEDNVSAVQADLGFFPRHVEHKLDFHGADFSLVWRLRRALCFCSDGFLGVISTAVRNGSIASLRDWFG